MTPNDIEPLKEYLAISIAQIIEDKESSGIEPSAAALPEILLTANTDIKEALNDMVRSGLLSFHKTLNSLIFEFTPPKQTNIKT